MQVGAVTRAWLARRADLDSPSLMECNTLASKHKHIWSPDVLCPGGVLSVPSCAGSIYLGGGNLSFAGSLRGRARCTVLDYTVPTTRQQLAELAEKSLHQRACAEGRWPWPPWLQFPCPLATEWLSGILRPLAFLRGRAHVLSVSAAADVGRVWSSGKCPFHLRTGSSFFSFPLFLSSGRPSLGCSTSNPLVIVVGLEGIRLPVCRLFATWLADSLPL